MVESFNPPTRSQLARMANNDPRLIRALEQLFNAAGVDVVDLQADLALLTIRVAINEGKITLLESDVDAIEAAIPSLLNGEFVFVSTKSDFPTPISGVITLADSTTYYVTSHIDLDGDRIAVGENSSIFGSDRSQSSLTSTGLSGAALFTGTKAFTLRDIGIRDVGIAFDLDSDDAALFLVWTGVNIDNCLSMGTIANYSSVIFSYGGIVNSAGLVFDGTIGTIAMDNMFIAGLAGATVVTIPSTATVTRRFRIQDSSIITPATGTGINVSASATIPAESYLLFDVNFSGSGTPLAGLQFDDTESMFARCNGIDNSRSFANYYMTANATATPITVSTPTKALGSTTNSPISQRFTHTNNRATYVGGVTRDFEVQAWAALSSNNNNVLRLYIAKNGVAITTFYGEGTANSGGKAEGLVVASVVEMEATDYIEVFVSNETSGNDVTDINMNVIVSEL